MMLLCMPGVSSDRKTSAPKGESSRGAVGEKRRRQGSEHRKGARALNSHPDNKGPDRADDRQPAEFLASQSGVVTVRMPRSSKTLLRHETHELGVAQRAPTDAGVVDLSESIERTVKNRLEQGAEHESGVVKFWLVFSR